MVWGQVDFGNKGYFVFHVVLALGVALRATPYLNPLTPNTEKCVVCASGLSCAFRRMTTLASYACAL